MCLKVRRVRAYQSRGRSCHIDANKFCAIAADMTKRLRYLRARCVHDNRLVNFLCSKCNTCLSDCVPILRPVALSPPAWLSRFAFWPSLASFHQVGYTTFSFTAGLFSNEELHDLDGVVRHNAVRICLTTSWPTPACGKLILRFQNVSHPADDTDRSVAFQPVQS